MLSSIKTGKTLGDKFANYVTMTQYLRTLHGTRSKKHIWNASRRRSKPIQWDHKKGQSSINGSIQSNLDKKTQQEQK